MNQHPDTQTLEDFAAGRLPKPQSDDVAKHLKECQQCARVFDTVSVVLDPVVEKSRVVHLLAQPLDDNDGQETLPSSLWIAGYQPVSGYTVLRRLGKGAFGEVWEATSSGGIPSALKRVDLQGDARLGEAELNALELLKRVRHPHLLSIHGFWIVNSTLVIACELADESLAQLMARETAPRSDELSTEQILRHLTDAAEALDYLGRPIHSVNNQTVRIQHCDVKPANLLLQGGAVKVADFGLAKPLHGVVENRSFSGTPAFAPPEFFQGKFTATSDQYSLAVTYCQLRTGKLPFSGSISEIAAGHVDGKPNLEGLSPIEQQIVARALSKDPALRWDCCTKFIGELQRSRLELSVEEAHSKQRTTANRQTDTEATNDFFPAPDTNASKATYQGKPVISGQMLIGEKLIPVPLKHTSLRVTVVGATAEVKVTQVFVNSGDCTIEATYVFPLPDDAAVNRMRMIVEDRIIESEVHENEEAKRMYDAAKQSGHGAVLLEQKSINIFTSSIANILPEQEVRVEITYLQVLPFDAGMYHLVVPLVVSDTAELINTTAPDVTHSTDAGVVSGMNPDFHRGDTIQIDVDLDAGVPLCGFNSPSHDIETVSEEGTSRVSIRLRSCLEIPNRDFVLTYRVRGPCVEHALFYEPPQDDEPGTFLLLTTPPFSPQKRKSPRRIVIVLGYSERNYAKSIALQFLDQLNPYDMFNVIAFGSCLSTLADSLLTATSEELQRARAFIQACEFGKCLSVSELLKPLQMALNQLDPQQPQASHGKVGRVLESILKPFRRQMSEPSKDHFKQMLMFISEGHPRVKPEFFAEIRLTIGKSRIIAIGDGRDLMNELAAASGGFAELKNLDPPIGEVRVYDLMWRVSHLMRRLGNPVLTDIELLYDKSHMFDVIPERVSNLYHELPIQIVGRFRGQMPPQVTMKGRIDGRVTEYPIVPEQVGRKAAGVPLAALWARRKIEALMEGLPGPNYSALMELRIKLAIRYRLASQFTSYIAVENRTPVGGDQWSAPVQVVVPRYSPVWSRMPGPGRA